VITRALAFACIVAAGVSQVVPAGASSSPGAPQGNVTPSAPAPARMGAAAVSAPVDGVVAVLLQNGTRVPLRIDRVNAVATRVDGGRATKASALVTYPQVVAPGEYALASVRFGADEASPGATVAVTVRSTPVPAARAARALSVGGLVLSPPQTGAVAQTLQATLSNGTTSWTARVPAAAVICFGEGGLPSTFAKARAGARSVAPGGSTPVTIPLTSLCPSYLVAARAT
jgi:hypothetical protein